ncbi:MAG: pirin family protein [Chlorobiales bacterium]|nr:pirin family protein [Chlorobiales bacterium]
MIEVRKAADRGPTITNWLRSYHSFSFGNYYDPKHLGFGPLVVLNDDYVSPKSGFGMHPHRDMEILTYVLEGELEHRDSTGANGVIRSGEVQRMSAGTGIRHSEYNPSVSTTTHLLQIWFEPETVGLQPSYAQKQFTPEQRHNRLFLVASSQDGGEQLLIHQDVEVYVTRLDSARELEYDISIGRGVYLHIIDGMVKANGVMLEGGDAIKLSSESVLHVKAAKQTELILFDLSMNKR